MADASVPDLENILKEAPSARTAEAEITKQSRESMIAQMGQLESERARIGDFCLTIGENRELPYGEKMQKAIMFIEPVDGVYDKQYVPNPVKRYVFMTEDGYKALTFNTASSIPETDKRANKLLEEVARMVRMTQGEELGDKAKSGFKLGRASWDKGNLIIDNLTFPSPGPYSEVVIQDADKETVESALKKSIERSQAGANEKIAHAQKTLETARVVQNTLGLPETPIAAPQSTEPQASSSRGGLLGGLFRKK